MKMIGRYVLIVLIAFSLPFVVMHLIPYLVYNGTIIVVSAIDQVQRFIHLTWG
jgi:hypothetical protein